MFCRRHLALCSAMNLHIYPSTSSLLRGGGGRMEIAQRVERMQVGWASQARGAVMDLSG